MDASALDRRKSKKMSPGSPVYVKIIITAVLAVLLVLFLFPIILIIMNSFKGQEEFMLNGPFSIPKFTPDVLVKTWQDVKFGNKLVNSFIISISVSVAAVALSLLNAYGISIGRIKGKTFFLIFFILAMTIPQEALAFPLYYFFKTVHLYDTRLSLIIILSVLQSSYGTYLLSSVFEAFPVSFLESAELDGCNKWMRLTRIVFPINLPSISVLFVFFFIWTWNEFFLPLIFLISNSNQTVPLAVTMFQGEHMSIVTMQSAASFLGILPCIIFFLIFQRTFVRGVAIGGIKG